MNLSTVSPENSSSDANTPYIKFNNSTAVNYKVNDFYEVWLYFSPFLLLFGVIGNLLVVVVMRRKRMKKTTTSVYLVALAVADTAALLTRIPPEFFKAAGVGTFTHVNEWTCRLEKFSFYTFSDIAIWILVMFTVDRFIAVCLPFYKQKVSTPQRAIYIIAGIIIVMILKNFHVFWTRGQEFNKDGTVKRLCGRPAFYFEQYIRPWIAFTFITLFPFIIIVCSNVSITVCLLKSTKRMRGLKVTPSRSASSKSVSSLVRLTTGSLRNSNTNETTNPKLKQAQGVTQTTLMCISTSIAFLICVSPSIILTLGRVHWINHPNSALPFAIARSINYQLSCLNHAINFFLYCFSGQRFRQELKETLKEMWQKFKKCGGKNGKIDLNLLKNKKKIARRFSFESTSADTGRKLETVHEVNEEHALKIMQKTNS